ncbi:divergent polysaccharide deacetylase family protein [Helicobacter turcicus]|uniref:Divergent polysaccharide deacetylase family protein n=1 Tax=Helicobacter turcicus TaxID=2867412 RepID=A0ABS7JP00_9HELI|nr:divergent polysaccharide deacetylase family protein [Helicobacter turcicus]MBX7491122.1 divergent polysaccharide deacetylase family protein [Helicobacter turcicus]MBX7545986.1 divergent polysaccharide deacetylase family protein [Helicobacter turcicus]
MDKVKPLTIGIIALLLVLLTFNFIPKSSDLKPQKNTLSPQRLTLENNTTLATNNAELIQKNIDFLKQHLEQMKLDSKKDSPTQDNITPQDSENRDSSQILDSKKDSTLATDSTIFSPILPKQTTHQNPEINSTACVRNKPQLAIIIDDISTLAQYKAITQIPFKLTPSLFPKSKVNPDTPKIAQIAPFYMIHLPLEALNFYQKEHKWLFVGDSKEKIELYINAIKQDFPNLSYINNHTGSKFTQDLKSMSLLLETLNTHHINFVDSRTIGATKTAAAYAKSPYIAFNPCQQTPLERDIFLDNTLEIPKITQQLIQAVQIAKQKGYAIAIGHPHKATFLALKNATDYLENSGIELVYIHEIITP